VQINNLKFTDDIALVAESSDDLHLLITRIDTESKRFGMTISTAKAEVQCIPPMKEPLDMEIKGEKLKQTTDFVYLEREGPRARNIRHRPTHRSCSWSRQGIDKHFGVKRHLYHNKGQTIQDIDACSTVVQLRDLDIKGGPNSETEGV